MRRWRTATGCWCARRPGPARPSSASSPCTSPSPRAASASTPRRSRPCPTRSTPTWSSGTAPKAVGLLTGDTSVNGDAPVVVMTTEVLRNMLYASSSTLDGLGYVVMDEVHYLADRFRGAVWEEVILHLPDWVRLVSLSATVSNAEEFGDWLVEVRGDTTVVVDEHRPVPLWQHMMVVRPAARPVRRRGPRRPSRGSTRTCCAAPRMPPGQVRRGGDRARRGRGAPARGPRFRPPSRVDVVSPARRAPACCRRSCSCSAGWAATPPSPSAPGPGCG